MTPVLLKVKRILWELESGYVVEVKDKAATEKPINVDDRVYRELIRNGDLRNERD